MKTLEIKPKEVYGRMLYYPVCEHAKLFAQLTGKATLTPETIKICESLGYTITTTQPEWR